MTRFKWNQFSQIDKFEDLQIYLDGNEYRHTNYYHYTNLQVIESILKNNEFWLSCVNRFNDKKDRKQFGDLKKQREFYSACFSTGVSENLPLWYLYSGTEGNGGRIRFTPSVAKNLVNTCTYTLHEYKNNKIGKSLLTLKNGISMNIMFKDVLYYRNYDGKVSLKYNTMTNYKFLSSKEIEENFNYFLKGLIWFYEKETRLIVQLKGEALKIVNGDAEIEYKVVLHFDDKIKNQFSIDFAPEITQIEEITNNEQYSNIKKKFLQSSKVKLSNYNGEIEMRICDDCEHKKKCNTCSFKKNTEESQCQK